MKNNNSINYLFSGVDKITGFNKEQTKYLKKDITENLNIVFIASEFQNNDKNDMIVNQMLKFFKKIDINFKIHYIIDNRITKNETKEIIKGCDIIYLLGGNPKKQIDSINEYSIKKEIKNHNGIIIGTSAGSMNQSKKITYLDEFNNIIKYNGLDLTDIFIYPHLDINNIDYLKEIMKVSKYQKIYSLPNDSFIRIENKEIEFIGDYYILG